MCHDKYMTTFLFIFSSHIYWLCITSSKIAVVYLVHEVLHVSVVVVGVLVPRPHHKDRPALLVETARVHLSRRVFLLDHVHLLRQYLAYIHSQSVT